MTKVLNGKIALVTGASRGIGRAIAGRLAADGAMVAVHYGKSRESADEVVSLIKQAGGDAFAIGEDLKAPGSAARLFSKLDAELKTSKGSDRIDILVNNAGIAPFIGFAETTEEILDDIYAVNVRAPFLLSQEAAKRLNDGGRIISVSSIVARLPFVAVAAYSALKAPIDNLTKALAVELGARNITVNAVAPGVIETDMAEFARSSDGADFAKSLQALKRLGQPEDIADVVGFLAGPDSRWVTGETIEVGGGTRIAL